MLDNGAFSAWRQGKLTDWPSYYEWADRWLDYPTTWAVIPDVIDGTEEEQDRLLREWPFGHRGAPVWHMSEGIDRLLALCDGWPRVCIGSTSIYAEVLSSEWGRRMNEVWDALARHHRRVPWVHMLRGMACSGMHWPFASVDSTDIARNHNRPQNTPAEMAGRWDGRQCPPRWCPTVIPFPKPVAEPEVPMRRRKFS
jgi:hypothetical protein